MPLSEIIYWADELRDPAGFSDIPSVRVNKKNALKLWCSSKRGPQTTYNRITWNNTLKNGFLKIPQNLKITTSGFQESAFVQGTPNNSYAHYVKTTALKPWLIK